jgi:dipeptidyl aminopeptidase/acylaminoacyl peptidase
MDGVKEDNPMHNDPLLERGIAVLAIDGPGQGETRNRGIKCTASNYEDAGKLACDFLVNRLEIDPDRLAIMGSSMGSYWGPRVAAVEPRFKACAVSGVNVEPGQNTIFNSASPTFKLNYMYMAGYDDESAFDEFAKTLTLKDVAPKIRCPYLIVAGEDDDLCPIEFVHQFMNAIPGLRVLVVYEGEKHSIRNPRARTLLVDWLADRLAGKPFKSEKIYVEMSGKETHSDW